MKISSPFARKKNVEKNFETKADDNQDAGRYSEQKRDCAATYEGTTVTAEFYKLRVVSMTEKMKLEWTVEYADGEKHVIQILGQFVTGSLSKDVMLKYDRRMVENFTGKKLITHDFVKDGHAYRVEELELATAANSDVFEITVDGVTFGDADETCRVNEDAPRKPVAEKKPAAEAKDDAKDAPGSKDGVPDTPTSPTAGDWARARQKCLVPKTRRGGGGFASLLQDSMGDDTK